MSRLETTRLLAEARDGDRAAMDALLARCSGKLISLIRARMGPRIRARLESRDLLQSVLVKVFSGIDRFDGRDGSSLMAWIARIAENEIRDVADRHGRARRDIAREVDVPDGPDGLPGRVRSQLSLALLDERRRRLDDALTRLSPEHREVIVLRHLEEHDFATIGQRMGRSADACRMLLARAMTALTLEVGRKP